MNDAIDRMLAKADECGSFEMNTCYIPGLRTWNFCGREYDVRWLVRHNYGQGYCEYDNNLLLLDAETAGWRLLEIAIHEGIHACLRDMPESQVNQIGLDVAGFTRRIMQTKYPRLLDRRKAAMGPLIDGNGKRVYTVAPEAHDTRYALASGSNKHRALL